MKGQASGLFGLSIVGALIGQLSSGHLATIADEIADGAGGLSPKCSLGRACRSGRSRKVTGRKLFVSHGYYNAWLSAERYVGRNTRL